MPAKPTTPIVLNGLGSRGLNTQGQTSTLGPEWLTEAENIVYDLEGRMGPRQGVKQISKTVASPVKSFGCYTKSDRTTECFGGSGSTIVKLDTTVTPNNLTTQSFSGTPQTITDSNWQWINFNTEFWGIQSGHKVINYDGTNWYDIDDLGAYAAPTGPTTFDPSCGLGEFGRMWYGGITEDPGTLYYSDNLIGEKLTGGAAGVLDLHTVWGNDEIVGLAALENKIVIFGKENIAIYKGAEDPSTMVLEELIRDKGLAGRDNIVYVGADIVFLSYEGLESFQRTTQTDGRSPLEGLTTTVRNALVRLLVDADVDNIKSCYYQKEGFVVTFMPDDDIAYCFDFALGKKEFPRITIWTFNDNPLCAFSTVDGKMYMGLSNSVAEYDGYYDVSISDVTGTYGNQSVCEAAGNTWRSPICWAYTNNQYNWSFQSPWLDLGKPVVAKIVKTGLMSISGGEDATSTIFISKDYEEDSIYSKTFTLTSDATTYLWGDQTSLYGIAKYAPAASPRQYRVPLARTGRVIRIKMTTEVKGKASTLITAVLLSKLGKIR